MRFTSWWNTRSQRLGKGHKSNHVNNVHQEGPELNSCPGGRVLKSDKGPFLDGAEWEAKRNPHFFVDTLVRARLFNGCYVLQVPVLRDEPKC